MKGGVSSEAEPPTKKQKKVKTQNESEATAAGKGSSEKEGSKDLELENKVTLTTIVSTLDNISKKFEQFDSRLEAYELDRNKPLMDQKTIDDRVKALLEEHLKVLGVGKIPENNDNPSPPSADKALSFASPRVTTQQNSVNSPALAATPGKVFGPKKNLAKELDKESGVKWTLAEEFGSGEEADEKKKAAQADAAFKRKEKAEAKKKAAEVKKKDAEAKKKEAEAKKKEAEGKKKRELKKKQEAELTKRKQAESKNKEVTPYDAVVREENEFAPESDVENQEVFVECLALGVTFDGINDKNIQGLRMKMAAEILDEGVNFVMSNLLAN
ncbi:hypothetical protein Bca4012_073412 [Brassica carinata]